MPLRPVHHSDLALASGAWSTWTRSPAVWALAVGLAATPPLLVVLTRAGALAQRDLVDQSWMVDLTWLASMAGILLAFAWLGHARGLTACRGGHGAWHAQGLLLLAAGVSGPLLVHATPLIMGGLPGGEPVRVAVHLVALALVLDRWLPAGVPRGTSLLVIGWFVPPLLATAGGTVVEVLAALLDPRASGIEGWWVVAGLGLAALPKAIDRR